MELDSKSLTELNLMTKAQIITEITKDRIETVCIKSIDSKEGQVSREFVTRDVAGALVKTEQWDWTYKPTGEVAEIFHIILDSKNVKIASEKIIHAVGSIKLISLITQEIVELKG